LKTELRSTSQREQNIKNCWELHGPSSKPNKSKGNWSTGFKKPWWLFRQVRLQLYQEIKESNAIFYIKNGSKTMSEPMHQFYQFLSENQVQQKNLQIFLKLQIFLLILLLHLSFRQLPANHHELIGVPNRTLLDFG